MKREINLQNCQRRGRDSNKAASLFASFLCVSLSTLSMTAADATRGGAPILGASSATAELFAPEFHNDAVLQSGRNQGATRRRQARLNLQGLKRAAGDSLRFNLFDDTVVDGVIEEVIQRKDGSLTLVGHLDGLTLSRFTVSVNREVVVANIRASQDAVFQVRYLGQDLHQIQQMDESQLAPCGNSPQLGVPARSGTRQVASPPASALVDNGTQLDLMVVYTAAARIAAGGEAAMQALINLAVDESNLAYRNSRVVLRLRLVHQGEIAYSESGSMYLDLDRLTKPADGSMDQVHRWRNTHRADVVSLLIGDSNLGGLGWQLTELSQGFEAYAFSVVRYDLAAGNLALAHEIGHNTGLEHDRANAHVGGLFNYSYGWRFTGQSRNQFRTVMAYQPGNLIPHFSNPNVRYDGVPTGASQANNALSMNYAAATAANWRQSIPPYWDLRFEIVGAPATARRCGRIDYYVKVTNVGTCTSMNVCAITGLGAHSGAGNWNANLGLVSFSTGRIPAGRSRLIPIHGYFIGCRAYLRRQYIKVEVHYAAGCFDNFRRGNYAQSPILIVRP